MCPAWPTSASIGFKKSHDQLAAGGRAGLVGTQNIRNNNSRAGGLDYIVKNGGVITEAVATQVWSGEAAVHVSIVNWEKACAAEPPGSTRVPRVGDGVPPSRTSEDVEERDASSALSASGSASRRDAATDTRDACAPRTCRLTFQRGDSVDSPWETFELPVINSSLSAGVDVGDAAELRANQERVLIKRAKIPGGTVKPEQVDEALKKLGEMRGDPAESGSIVAVTPPDYAPTLRPAK